MARRSEILRRFIRTVIEQLPAYIAKYPSEDQSFLNNVFAILQACEDKADNARALLSKQLEEYCQKQKSTDAYLDLSFLWFSVDYFGIANLELNVARFHAVSFYEHLVQSLRGTHDIAGFFKLVRDKTPLDHQAWEDLQLFCSNLRIPLTNEELQVIETVYSLITKFGFNILNQRRINKAIKESMNSSGIKRNFSKLFILLDSYWYPWFYYPAFGLNCLFFQFQLNDSIQLTDIIDFQNTSNTVLVNSDVYQVRGFQNTYTGKLMLPSPLINKFQRYLQNCKHEGKLILQEFAKINDSRVSASLSLYQAEKGWRKITKSAWRRKSRSLKTTRPRKRHTKNSTLYISSPFNPNWHFRKNPNPLQVIKVFCESLGYYSFDQLPFSSTDEQTSQRFSKFKMSFLKELYRREVVRIGFFSQRLNSEFSPDQYWIITPVINFEKLTRLLEWPPLTKFYFSEKNIYIWAHLPQELARWLSQDLGWTVLPIQLNHYPLPLDFSCFDSKALEWKTPFILKEPS
ncbi:MAG: hypothetical protein ACXADY_21880 [Candidatus Hodarchaeales archaeon]